MGMIGDDLRTAAEEAKKQHCIICGMEPPSPICGFFMPDPDKKYHFLVKGDETKIFAFGLCSLCYGHPDIEKLLEEAVAESVTKFN
jgi:hypothetical protein